MQQPNPNHPATEEKDFSLVGVSEYAGVRDKKGVVTSLYEVFERIADPASPIAAMVARLRALIAKNDPKADELKKQLPAVTFSGTFSKREVSCILTHSHIVVADIDHHDKPDDLVVMLAMYPCVVGAFVSPSGQGVKALIAINKAGDHLKAWERVADFFLEEFRIAIDPSGKDVSRLCFLSSDPNCYMARNLVATPLEVATELETGRYTRVPATVIDPLERMGQILNDITIPEAQRVLSYISADCSREQWLNVGLALHVQFDHSEEAAELFDLWSSGGLGVEGRPPNYDGPEDCAKTWKSLKDPSTRSRVATFRSVLRMAYDAGMPTSGTAAKNAPPELKKSDNDLRQSLITRIREATDVTMLTGEIAELIANSDMFPSTRNDLVDMMATRYFALTDKKAKLKDLRDATTFKHAEFLLKEGTPAWAAPWVFCNADRAGTFYNKVNGATMDPAAFNSTYQSACISPYEKAAGRVVPAISPVNLVLGGELIPTVNGIRYQPGAPEFFEEPGREGMLLVNTYRADSMPDTVEPEDWTDQEAEDVARWKRHITWLLPKEEAHLLLQFLAYVVRYPARRVGWAFLIQGPEGIGKSIIGTLMRNVMGIWNVKSIDNSTLGYKNFNEWAEGAQLSLIEEVYVDGASKWEIMNTLKPVITNERISIHPKGKKPYEIRNVTSYLMFTNHRDALPLQEGDRRYYISETRIRDRHDFIKVLGGDVAKTQYFIALVAAAERSPGALRGFFRRLDMKGFDPTNPPTSKAKEQLIMSSVSNDELLVREVIAAGTTKNVNELYVELESLKAAIEFRAVLSGQALGRLLRKMGYDAICPSAIFPKGGTEKSRWFANKDAAYRRGVDIYDQSPFVAIRLLSEYKERNPTIAPNIEEGV